MVCEIDLNKGVKYYQQKSKKESESERSRERQRHSQRPRETETKGDTETKTETMRDRDRERQREKQSETKGDTETTRDRDQGRHRERHRVRKTRRHRHQGGQRERQTENAGSKLALCPPGPARSMVGLCETWVRAPGPLSQDNDINGGGDICARSKQEPRQRDPRSLSCDPADTRDRAGSTHKPTGHRRDSSEFYRKDCCRAAGVPGLRGTPEWP